MDKSWREKRTELSEQFDEDCFELSRELIALELREVQALKEREPGLVGFNTLKEIALAARKTQEMGRMALGETTDRKQLDLDFGQMPVIEMVIRDAKRAD